MAFVTCYTWLHLTMLRRAALAAGIGAPTVVLGACAVYREQHRPQLPPHALRSLAGATCVVTGGTSGIGKAVAGRLVARGANVIVGSRDVERGAVARRDILADAAHRIAEGRGAVDKHGSNVIGDVEMLNLDLTDLHSVKQFARNVRERESRTDGKRIQVIVAAAAEIMPERSLTKQEVDCMFATNHLGLHLLLRELEPTLLSGCDGPRAPLPRVVMVGSKLEKGAQVDFSVVEASGGVQLRRPEQDQAEGKEAGKQGVSAMSHYADTKFCNLLLARELSRRWEQRAAVFVVSPGMVDTNLWRHFPTWYRAITWPVRVTALRSTADAADGVMFAVASDSAEELPSGSLLADGVPVEASAAAHDAIAAASCFTACERVIERALSVS